jgi:hypothetical protein
MPGHASPRHTKARLAKENMMTSSATSQTAGFLTDGTGVSPGTWTKFVKDFTADVLLSGAAALAAVQIIDFGAAINQPQIAAFALAGAVIRAAYRAALRWATS